MSLHHRNTSTRRRPGRDEERSEAWQLFIKRDDDSARCCVCEVTVSTQQELIVVNLTRVPLPHYQQHVQY